MMPLYHIFFGFIFSLALYFLLKLNIYAFLVLFLSTWVFDIESAIVYAIRNFDNIRKRGLRWTYRYVKRKREMLKELPKRERVKRALYSASLGLFHTLEFILALFLVLLFIFKHYGISLIYPLCFLFGILFHLCLDIAEGIATKEKFSLILMLIARRKLKNKQEERWVEIK
jgi:hypothetical protein